MKQNYEKSIIEWLFHQYFPEKEVLTYELFDWGVENSNFLIQALDWKYVLKVFENSKNEMEVVQSEVQLMNEARNKWIHTPEVFSSKNTGERITLWPDTKPVILMEFIEGKQFRHSIPENTCLYNLWRETALLHNLLKEITGTYLVPYTHKFDFKYIINNRELRNVESPYINYSILEKIWKEIDWISDSFLELDQQIIHNDLNNGNVVFTADMIPYLIDFSDIVVSSRVQDIAISLTQWCFARNWYPEGVRHYLSGYGSVNHLSDKEKKCLFAGVQIRMVNILLIPYLDTGMSDPDDFLELTKQYMEHIKRFDDFWKENFMKLIF